MTISQMLYGKLSRIISLARFLFSFFFDLAQNIISENESPENMRKMVDFFACQWVGRHPRKLRNRMPFFFFSAIASMPIMAMII